MHFSLKDVENRTIFSFILKKFDKIFKCKMIEKKLNDDEALWLHSLHITYQMIELCQKHVFKRLINRFLCARLIQKNDMMKYKCKCKFMI